jgi:hypothetical protein
MSPNGSGDRQTHMDIMGASAPASTAPALLHLDGSRGSTRREMSRDCCPETHRFYRGRPCSLRRDVACGRILARLPALDHTPAMGASCGLVGHCQWGGLVLGFPCHWFGNEPGDRCRRRRGWPSLHNVPRVRSGIWAGAPKAETKKGVSVKIAELAAKHLR